MKKLLLLLLLFPLLVSAQVLNLNNNTVTIDDDGDMFVNGQVEYELPHCDGFVTGASYTKDLGAGASGKLTPTLTVKEQDYITFEGDTITLLVAGDYFFYFSFSGSGTVAKDWSIIPRTVVSAGAPTPVIDAALYFSGDGATNYTAEHWSWYITNLAAGTSISFWLTNVTDATDFTFKEIQVSAIKTSE